MTVDLWNPFHVNELRIRGSSYTSPNTRRFINRKESISNPEFTNAVCVIINANYSLFSPKHISLNKHSCPIILRINRPRTNPTSKRMINDYSGI